MLKSKKYLVTAGPTQEAIDPVRYISNHSTGKMGYAIAAELARRGAQVILVSGPVCLPTPTGVRRIDVVSAEEMYQACVELWPQMDGAVMCAAVADYTPVSVSDVKAKKSAADLTLTLKPTRDIAAELGRTKRTDQLLVGFALETDNEKVNALSKLTRKNLDFIVLNSLRDAGAGFGGDTNKITIFSRPTDPAATSLKTEFPLETKQQAAAHIINTLSAFLK